MSVIAISYNESDGHCFPVIMADILTSTNYGRNYISLPTFYEGVKNVVDKHTPYLPSGLMQKIHIIRDNLVAGLAGKVSENIDMLKEAKSYFNYTEPSTENIRDLVQNTFSQMGLKDSLFCFVLIEPGGIVKSFEGDVGRGKWIEKTTPYFGSVKACGSGAEKFIGIANRRNQPS